jgi:hypothetical protein
LDVLENSKPFLPNLDEIVPGSDFDAWRNHWGQKTIRYMEKWAANVAAEDQTVFGEAVERFNSLKASLGELNYRKQPFESSASNDMPPRNESQLKASDAQSIPWFSFFGCLIILVVMSRTTSMIGTLLANRPWWSYLLLGLLAWIVTGSVLPTLVLGTIGLVVAVDCYWMVTSRLRRIETRGLR